MKRLITAIIAFAASCAASASGFVPADQAFDFFLSNRSGKVSLVVNVMPGFALYREKLVIKGEGATITRLSVPRGEVVNDPELGTSELLTGQVVVTFDVTDKLKPASNVLIRYMGCKRNDYCYPPQTATLPLVPQ